MEETKKDFNLDVYKRASQRMVAANDKTFNQNYYFRNTFERVRDYTEAEIDKIVASGSLEELISLSRNYFNKDGLYKQLIVYYATLLQYSGMLIPNPSFGNSLSTSYIQKKYYNAVDFVESMNLNSFFIDCAIKALRDGCYYGVITEKSKGSFCTFDLPPQYCRTLFKDILGNNVIEFNLAYFYTIVNEDDRKKALAAYPDSVQKAWKNFTKKGAKTWWVEIPVEASICFPFFDGRPYFANVIKQTIRYDDAIELDKERNLEEIRKILVQKVPHLTDGRLLFEPDEAAEMHMGAVNMLKGNKNLSVLTTYTDVDAIVSKTTADANTDNTISKMYQNVYSQAGASSEIFSSTGSTTLESSINKDIALMMYLANKFARFVSYLVNSLYANSNISFKYTIFPISYQNQSKYTDEAYKLAGSGYSFLLPALALGISQKDLSNIKDLENDLLKLSDKLKPLSSTHTQSGNEQGGAPKKEASEKAETTIEKEKSLDNQTGGSK